MQDVDVGYQNESLKCKVGNKLGSIALESLTSVIFRSHATKDYDNLHDWT